MIDPLVVDRKQWVGGRFCLCSTLYNYFFQTTQSYLCQILQFKP